MGIVGLREGVVEDAVREGGEADRGELEWKAGGCPDGDCVSCLTRVWPFLEIPTSCMFGRSGMVKFVFWSL